MTVLRRYCLSLLVAVVILTNFTSSAVAENFVVTVGQDKVFTEFNYHDQVFENDPNNILPWPVQRVANSANNIAFVSLSAVPNEAGVAIAKTGVQFTWGLGQYSWDQIKDLPVDVTLDFSYDIAADWQLGTGSANSFVGSNLGYLGPWYDGIGFESGQSIGSRSATISRTHTILVKDLPTTIFLESYCQAHNVADSTRLSNSCSSRIAINSIRINLREPSSILEFPSIALPVIAVIGLIFIFHRRKVK